MAHILEFEKIIQYDSGRRGISVDVKLRYVDISIKFEAKVDTGSTYCIFRRIYGEDLGIEIETGFRQSVGTATDSFIVFGHQITMLIEGYEFSSTIYFAQDFNFNRNVLGRHGFLDRVIIGINDYDGKLYLNRYENE